MFLLIFDNHDDWLGARNCWWGNILYVASSSVGVYEILEPAENGKYCAVFIDAGTELVIWFSILQINRKAPTQCQTKFPVYQEYAICDTQHVAFGTKLYLLDALEEEGGGAWCV